MITKNKVGLAQGLFLRAFRICDPSLLNDEINHVRTSLKRLAYPTRILNKANWKARNSYFCVQSQKAQLPEIDKNIIVPYVPTLESFKPALRNLNTGLVFQYKNKLKNVLTKNNPTNSKSIQCGVYKIPCKVCNKVYIGETGRDLSKRLTEHKNDIVNQKPESGVAAHVFETSHNFDFEHAQIVYSCNNKLKRHIVESALIAHDSDMCVNLNFGFSPHNQLLSRWITSLITPECN